MALFSFEKINTGDNRPRLQPKEEQQLLYLSIYIPMVFVILMWIVKLFEVVTEIDLGVYGILPQHLIGLRGILFSPFLHADWDHLLSNTVPFFILSFLMIFNYRKVAYKSFLFIYFFGGLLLWITGRENYHIGASGLIYGMAFFIFFSGVFRKNIQSIALSLFVVFLYGSIVWGVLPVDLTISWEGHLMGAICGGISAFYFRKVDLPAPVILPDEPDDELSEEALSANHETIQIHYEIVDKVTDKP